ncbi:MAG: hypothetical protein CL582_04180 [Alteromonadaceae bacterium]|nr:hypothetical protein [Alteromonadaceae bacterium]|tara:strand:- start:4318 stop:5532 length:1215 start_codon:yes stop_codon:yes gene_type:complete
MNRLNGTFPLRFPEFNTVWKKYRLGQLVDIRSAARVHKDEWQESGVPFFRTSDVVSAFNGSVNKKAYISENLYSKLIKKSGEVKRHDLLVTGGGSIGVPYLIKSNDPLYFKDADLLWIKSTEELYGPFLYQFLLSPIFRRYLLKITHTGTISHYTIEQAKATEIMLPKSTEQKKIADFLSAVDAKIRLLKEKHALLQQYKKGVMQKLFSQEIRFKDDNNQVFPDWKFRQGNELFSSVSDKKHNSDLPILAITQEHGAIPRDLINYQVQATDSSVASYKVVNKGDFIISLRSFQGGIEYSQYKGICSPAYIILRPCSELVDDFYRYYLKTGNFIQEMKRRLEGIRDGKILSYKYFSEIKLPYPCVAEQQKIAEFLQALDEKLAAVQQQIDLTQTFKKGLLQQMFV